jgi:hypothetical protein
MPLSPRELLTSELPAFLALWEQAPTAETARTLLALWAGLRRLERAQPDPDEDRLNLLVRDEAARLVQLAYAAPLLDGADWLRRAEDLDRAWDEGEEDLQELDWQAHELFERLDRASLAAWAVEKLAEPDTDAGRLAAAREALARAEEFLAARSDVFLCLATDAAAVLSSVRPGLEEDEAGLWETLLKHRRIEEARDELEMPPARAALLAAARQNGSSLRLADQGLDQPPRDRDNDWSFMPEPLQMMAADAPRPAGMDHRYWREPGGPHRATLAVDRADAVTPLRLNFYRGREQAIKLVNTPVWLAECESVIDADGNAEFPQERLRLARDAGRAVTLRVGVERVAWQRVEYLPA